MFKNKNQNGTLNLCGGNIRALRIKEKLSQRELADQLQLQGVDLGKNAVQQIESRRRFVTDIELSAFAKQLRVSADVLLGLP